MKVCRRLIGVGAVDLSRMSVNLLVLAASIFLLAGCAGSEQYRAGKKFLAAGEYDEAVTAFHQALAQDPNNSNYLLSLAEAQSLAADEHVEQAETLLEKNHATAARRELQIALDQVPAHPRAILLINTVAKEIERCEELVAQARIALAGDDWSEAGRLAGEAIEVDPSHPEAQQLRKDAVAAAVANHLARGEEALEARDWKQCAEACARIKALDGSNAAAAELERKAADRAEALRLFESAAPLEAQGDHFAAISPLRQAAELWPENETITAKLEQVTDLAVGGLLAQADSEIAAGRFSAGIEAIDRALTITPTREDLIQRRQQAVQGWTDAMLGACARRATAGEWELAWPLAVQAIAISPSAAARATQACFRAEEAIRKEITYNLSVLPLKSSSVGMGDALVVCHAFVGALGRVKPEHVHLLERTNLPEVLAEHDLSLASITDPKKLGLLGRKLDGTDIFLFIDAVAREHTDRRTERQAVSKYVAGKKSVPNPDYAAAQEEFKQAERALSRARSVAMMNELLREAARGPGSKSDASFLEDAAKGYFGLKAQQAAEAYNAALMKLNSTPQRLQVDDWREHRYPVYRIQRQVSVNVSLRLVEVATGRILWTDNETVATAVDADTLIEPDPARGVAGKAVLLKDARELQAEAIDQLKPLLHAKARELLMRRSAVYWEDAQKEAGDQAVGDYVRFLFDCPAGPDPRAVDSALEGIFRPHMAGERLSRCKRIVIARLNLQRPAPLAARVDGQVGPRQNPTSAPAVAPAPPRPGPLAVVEPAPGTPAPAAPPGPVVGPDRPSSPVRPVPPPEPVQPEPPAQLRPSAPPPSPARQPDGRPVCVFRGTVSRDDDRYPKELKTVDGIVVKVKDTDPDPLDADLEIRVGRFNKGYKDRPVGTRINGRGVSGRAYQFVILAIDDDEETVHFAIEAK